MANDRVVETGSGTMVSPELVLRQALWEGVERLRGDRVRLDELFERVDNLRQGSAALWKADMIEALDRLVDLEGSDGRRSRPLRILVGYPRGEAVLPAWSILIESGGEALDEAVAGDILDDIHERRGSDEVGDPDGEGRTIRARVKGVGWQSVIQLSTWALTPEVSLLMHEVLKHILLAEKGRLGRAGITETSLTENGFVPDPQQWPRVGFTPSLRCTMRWTLRQTHRRGPVPTGYTLRPVRRIA